VNEEVVRAKVLSHEEILSVYVADCRCSGCNTSMREGVPSDLLILVLLRRVRFPKVDSEVGVNTEGQPNTVDSATALLCPTLKQPASVFCPSSVLGFSSRSLSNAVFVCTFFYRHHAFELAAQTTMGSGWELEWCRKWPCAEIRVLRGKKK
jgi:hypothetical protein